MKTRDELRLIGVLLEGPVVPEWFKRVCDGCSVPGRLLRLVLKAEYGRAACVIHDFEYWLAAVQFEPGTAEWVGARAAADYRLRINRAKVAKSWIVGWIYGRLYWRGVRFGGVFAMLDRGRALAMPPTRSDLDEVRALVQWPVSRRGQVMMEVWSDALEWKRD